MRSPTESIPTPTHQGEVGDEANSIAVFGASPEVTDGVQGRALQEDGPRVDILSRMSPRGTGLIMTATTSHAAGEKPAFSSFSRSLS
ncbi:MAG TPA: hypothetical protein VLE69_04275 [Candidatus Saccharimonadales bacterium]|nr:hypothetical protein [Candidatus Saccharimonadales bacterium]